MKFLSTVLSILILSTSLNSALAVGGPEVGTTGFTDVGKGYQYETAIEFVKTKGIVNGYADGTFKPEQTINRAEFTKILIEAIIDQAKINNCLNENSFRFTDVGSSDWFAPYVCMAKVYAIINGYSDGSFGPGNTINYAEAAKIISNSFDLPIAGVNEGQEWFVAFTIPLENIEAVPASISGPSHKITRAEMAEIIYRLREYLDPAKNSIEETDQEENEEVITIEDQDKRTAVISLVNQERAKENLPPMRYNSFLEKSAQAHADDMKARNYFEHNTPEGTTAEDRIDRDGYLQPFKDCLCSKSYIVGENIAKGQSSAAEVVETWMNSPDHRANIMNPDFNEIGIGITAVDPSDTGFIGFYWVQNFGAINLE